MTVKIIEKTTPEKIEIRVPTQVIAGDPIAVKLVQATEARDKPETLTLSAALERGCSPSMVETSQGADLSRTGKMTNDEIMRQPYEERRRVLLEDERVGRLEEKLLSLGGDRVALVPEPHADMLLERGERWSNRVHVAEGEPNGCHGNTAALWVKRRHGGYFKIVTGWGLTKDDGYWRQHTWGLDKELNRIIETTTRRSVYFGVMLTEREAGHFYLQNAPEAQRVLQVFHEVVGSAQASG